ASYSWNYGFDFALPLNVLYYGMNWNKSSSITSRYMTDYNADGFQDIVDQGSVFFGQPSALGDYTFALSSQNTPNPVLFGQAAVQPSTDEPIADMQIVKIWEAPFTGTIDISGNAI